MNGPVSVRGGAVRQAKCPPQLDRRRRPVCNALQRQGIGWTTERTLAGLGCPWWATVSPVRASPALALPRNPGGDEMEGECVPLTRAAHHVHHACDSAASSQHSPLVAARVRSVPVGRSRKSGRLGRAALSNLGGLCGDLWLEAQRHYSRLLIRVHR
eukprot:scaffold19983_cov146-Isochrysis_galbana.AAC.1